MLGKESRIKKLKDDQIICYLLRNVSFASDRAFDGLLQLLTLNLSSNAIETLDMGAFMGLVSLQDMDLSHNFIEKLDNKSNGVLDNCLSLRKVQLLLR